MSTTIVGFHQIEAPSETVCQEDIFRFLGHFIQSKAAVLDVISSKPCFFFHYRYHY